MIHYTDIFDAEKLSTLVFCALHRIQNQPVRDASGKVIGYVCSQCLDPMSGGMFIRKLENPI